MDVGCCRLAFAAEVRDPCEEITVSVGFNLFRLKKLNKRNFNDIMLNVISEQQR